MRDDAAERTPPAGDAAAQDGAAMQRDRGERRNVYSFCMCPGGQVVPTSVDGAELCVNGMSFSRRNSRWANSALVVGVSAADWAPFEVRRSSRAARSVPACGRALLVPALACIACMRVAAVAGIRPRRVRDD